MKINLKTLENLILQLIIGQVVIFRFFNVYETFNKIITLLIILSIILRICTKKNMQTREKGTLGAILLVVVLIAVNGAIYGIGGAYQSNFLMLMYPIIFMLFITMYIKSNQDVFYKTLFKLRYVINGYFLLNVIVMFIQLQGTYFMVGYSTWENTMYEDLVSGLMGYSMTAGVCYFSAFVIAYNTVIARAIKRRFRKKLFISYNIILAITMAYISTQNDNVQYFVFLPLTLIVMMFSTYQLRTVSGIQKVFMISIVCLFIIITVLMLNSNLYNKLNDSVFYKFIGAIEHMYDGPSVTHGSMERLALLIYSLKYSNGWQLGSGFSSSGVYTPGTLGFVHFGNANIGAIVSLGGIWFYLALVLLYSLRIVPMIENYTYSTKRKYYAMVIPLFFMATTLFSLPFTDVSISLCIMFIMISFGFNQYMNHNLAGYLK